MVIIDQNRYLCSLCQSYTHYFQRLIFISNYLRPCKRVFFNLINIIFLIFSISDDFLSIKLKIIYYIITLINKSNSFVWLSNMFKYRVNRKMLNIPLGIFDCNYNVFAYLKNNMTHYL